MLCIRLRVRIRIRIRIRKNAVESILQQIFNICNPRVADGGWYLPRSSSPSRTASSVVMVAFKGPNSDHTRKPENVIEK